METEIREFFLKKYGKYTEIQEKALPIVANGDNCVIIAPTGSGKTEAAVLSLLDRIAKDQDRSGIKLIYITPLRALNRDMIRRLEELCKVVGVTVAVRHGDTPQSERSKQARRAPEVLITTPETLQSILPTKSVGVALKNVVAVVIDEIHELYHNKRGAQLSIALERLNELAPNFQRIGISATVGDPGLISAFLCNDRPCKVASVEALKQMHLRVEFPRNHDKRLAEMLDKFSLDNESLARLGAIAKHIENSKSTIVFANTRQVVEALGSRLVYLNRIEPFGGIGIHHSSLDRNERINVENAFKAGEIKGIIATSSLELGIDIGNIDLVVQYGSPRQSLRIIQRVGRSGHTIKGTSKGVIIAINMVDVLESIAIASNVSTGTLERFSVQKGAGDVLANQICGIALDRGVIEVQDLAHLIKRSYVYRDFEDSKLVALLEFMNKQKLVGFDGQRVSSGPRTRLYYYSHLSVIPDSKRYIVKNVADNRIISSLDENFVVSNVEDNSIFITKGLPWKVISIDENVITVEPSSDLEAAVPDWSGEDIPVSKSITQKVFDIMNSPERIDNWRFADERLNEDAREFIKSQRMVELPSNDYLLIEQAEEYKILHTGLGTLANEALSRLLAHRISAKLGRSVSIKASPYLIFLELPSSVNAVDVLKGINENNVEQLLRDAVQDTELLRYKFVTIAKLFGVIDRDATVSKSVAKRVMSVLKDSPVYHEAVRELMQNYFDIQTLKGFFANLNTKLKVRAVHTKDLSPLAKTILNSAYYTRELIMPLLPSDAVIDSFSKFMLSKSMKLLCTYCGMTFTRKISEIKDQAEIKCPNCASPLITPYSEEYEEVIKKRKEGKRLTKSEHETLKEFMKQASLFSSYGGKAAVALSTYGVGPTSAARILMMFRRHEKLFYTDLIEAQKQFIKNKKYWAI